MRRCSVIAGRGHYLYHAGRPEPLARRPGPDGWLADADRPAFGLDLTPAAALARGFAAAVPDRLPGTQRDHPRSAASRFWTYPANYAGPTQPVEQE